MTWQRYTLLFIGILLLIVIVWIVAVHVDVYGHQVANGFVDGNNNGKDDVLETWDSLGLNNTDWENQKHRYDLCMSFYQLWKLNNSLVDQIWNGSSCHLKELK
jgi:hypothetical protein